MLLLQKLGVIGLVACFGLALGCGPGQPGDPIIPDPTAAEEGAFELPEQGAEGAEADVE